MAQTEEGTRPTPVTAIGWIWAVLAVYALLRSLVNLVSVAILQAQAPAVLQAIEARALFLGPLYRHAIAVNLAEAAASVAVGFFAFSFLRMRIWARVAIQAVCWLALVSVATLEMLLLIFLPRLKEIASREPDFTESKGRMLFGACLGIGLMLAAALAVMIVLLRSERVRSAFAVAATAQPARPG